MRFSPAALPLLLCIVLCQLLLVSCGDEEVATVQSLQNYLDERADWPTSNELIACAAGGQSGWLDDEDFPISVFLKPHYLGVSDVRYYESVDVDPQNLANFIEKAVPKQDLFIGFLQRFRLPASTQNGWARVSFLANDTLWYCKAIRLNHLAQPSLFAPESCSIDLSNPIEPLFQWQDSGSGSNIIYFQVLSDQNNAALSGTYTTDTTFRFYHTDNVVLNVTHPGEQPQLFENRSYTFTLMGVDADNWVNLIIEKTFQTQ